MTAERIDPDLEAQLQDEPGKECHLLVRVTRVEDQYEREITEHGLVVRRRMRLVPSYAVTGPASAALKLLRYPWVMHIEEDRPVHIA